MRGSNTQPLLGRGWTGLPERETPSETIQRFTVGGLPPRMGGGQRNSWGRGGSERRLTCLGAVT